MYRLYSPRTFRTLTIIVMSSLCLLLNFLTKINFNNMKLAKNIPEYTAKMVSGNIYDETGNLLYYIKSQVAWQYPENNKLFLQYFNAISYESNIQNFKYNLTSNDGWINYNDRTGFLGKNTHLIINDNDIKKITNIWGQAINLDLKKNLFLSSESVIATQNNSKLSGVGFSYNKNTQILILNSKVHVIWIAK